MLFPSWIFYSILVEHQSKAVQMSEEYAPGKLHFSKNWTRFIQSTTVNRTPELVGTPGVLPPCFECL